MITPEDLAKSGTEHGHQAALFCYFQIHAAEYPLTKWLHSSGNGIFTTSGQKGKEKAAGLKKGVWDILLPHPSHGACGLWVEMKVKNNKLTPEQIRFRNDLANWYEFVVCYSWEEGRDTIINYLEGR